MAKDSNVLHKKVIAVTYRYLGPAADRFVYRQCQSHLNKRPEQLRKTDLKDLIVWFSLAMSTLSEDPAIVKQFESELKKLAGRTR